MKPRIAVIICVYVPRGQVEEGCPVISVRGNGRLEYTENKLNTVKCALACHEHYSAGEDYDLIIVNNNSADAETIDILSKYKNVYWRENKGFSFGAFQWAFEKFKSEYDYFVFEEQDFAPIKHGWLTELYDVLNSDANIGAVGNVLEVRDEEDFNLLTESLLIAREIYPGIKQIQNFDGQMTCVKTSVLEDALKQFPWKIQADYQPTVNELIFQMPLVLAGYKLLPLQDAAMENRIGTYGQRFMDSTDRVNALPLEKLMPMVNCNARLFHPRFKELMSWYNG